MEKPKAQSFEHHTRIVPIFHLFVLPVLMIHAIWRLVLLKNGISFESALLAVVAIALVILAICGRVFVLSVQDRVIRMEMEMRLEKLLPGDLRPRIGEFTVEQMIALRFAGDEECPALARQVLDEKLADRKSIKRRIKKWRPDFMRA